MTGPSASDDVSDEPVAMLIVSGSDANRPHDLRQVLWINQALAEGDEVLIRVLPEGQYDIPIMYEWEKQGK
jgi:hypothetical protein